ncbi:hypothetical protein RchiOBHm_Chr1g0318681 [Rosa chinensis]|uniref:Uncharacterized protein n=1 Tax=Rosa chinensis TaxID=74649 RepID=A0A2P6S8B2_ROSCH|nr:hypothetical protein RchiOBHm_Chr1g0318681 [Rosa chinensis]
MAFSRIRKRRVAAKSWPEITSRLEGMHINLILMPLKKELIREYYEQKFGQEVQLLFFILQSTSNMNQIICLVESSWPRNVEIRIATWWVKMWGYSARACCQAFYA